MQAAIKTPKIRMRMSQLLLRASKLDAELDLKLLPVMADQVEVVVALRRPSRDLIAVGDLEIGLLADVGEKARADIERITVGIVQSDPLVA